MMVRRRSVNHQRSHRSTQKAISAAPPAGMRMNITTASQVGSSRLKSTPSACRSSEPPTVAPTNVHPQRPQPPGQRAPHRDVHDADDRAEAGRDRQQEHRGQADLADLEAVVADAAANRVLRRDAQHPHRYPSTDAPDQEPGPRSRRGAEQHAAGWSPRGCGGIPGVRAARRRRRSCYLPAMTPQAIRSPALPVF